MKHLALVSLLFLAAGLVAAPGAVAQQAAFSSSQQEESAATAVRAARREQSRFEGIRRSNLPWAWGGGGGECDERIGRFCLTRGDSDDDDWRPPEEAEVVVSARDRLIGRLEEAAAIAPADGWVAGQRVRYLVEAGRAREAAAAARDCRADRWWCLALEGFALHSGGDAGAAEVAFEGMLAAMPEDERRDWTDLSLLLDSCLRREYRRAGDAGRDAFETRFWRLADPFATRPGNEIRSEHFSRHVWDRLQDRARSTEGIPWGGDLREIVLRFGWPRAWERIRGRSALEGPPPMVSHYPSSGRDPLPPCEAIAGSETAEWDVEDRRGRASYSLPLADSTVRWLYDIDHQLAFFRRGDSAVVVAAYRLPPDSIPADVPIEAAVGIMTGQGDAPPLVSRLQGSAITGRVATAAPAGRMLVTLEVLAPEAGRAARVRREAALPALGSGVLALSDILLLDGAELPESLEDATGAARTSTRVSPGERVSVFWEMYGLTDETADDVAFTVSLAESRTGWLTRLGRRIGLMRTPTPVRVRWHERTDGTGELSRSLTIEIPPELSAGEYTLQLSASVPGREDLVARRIVQVQEEP